MLDPHENVYFLISVLSGAPIQVEEMPDSAKIEWGRERERERVYVSSVKRLEHKGRITLLPLLQYCRERERKVGWGGWEVD